MGNEYERSFIEILIEKLLNYDIYNFLIAHFMKDADTIKPTLVPMCLLL